jgi:hypothetical protein
MRTLRHLAAALAVATLLVVAAVAFILYDPTAGGSRFLSASALIEPKPGTDPALIAAEPTVQLTDPAALAALALRYQPTVIVSALDRFWPTSLVALLGSRWATHGPCLVSGGRCRVHDPTVTDLSGSSSPVDYLQFPAPVDSVQDTFRSAARELGVPAPAVLGWPRRPAAIDPFASAQVYFYYLNRTSARAYPGVPRGLISLEYWFYYPLNYFPLVRVPLEALSNPIGSTLGNTDYHQGDVEHVAVLIDPKSMRPRYLWMARHADEGQAYRWHSRSVQWNGDHASVYAALGSHASYARCGIQRRIRTYLFINDYVVCIPHQTYAFTYWATPLVDLAHTGWACWRGHLGEAGRGLIRTGVAFVPFETDGPVSPLLQQENFGSTCRVRPGTPKPPTPL